MTKRKIISELHHKEIKFHIDEINATGISGWVCDTRHPRQRLTVEVSADRKPIITEKAKSFRKDLNQLNIGDGHCGFRFVFPVHLYDGKPHEISARILESNEILLPPTHVTLAKIPGAQSVRGVFEHVDQNDLFVSGWAISDTGALAKIEAIMDGECVARGVANLMRPDLLKEGFGRGDAGFKIYLPLNRFSKLSHKIEIRADGQLLIGGPKEVPLYARTRIEFVGIRDGILSCSAAGFPGEEFFATLIVNGDQTVNLKFEQKKSLADGTHIHKATWEIPEKLRDGRLHVYSVEVPYEGGCLRTDPRAYRCPEYLLNIEVASPFRIAGWGVRIDSPRPLNLAVTYDGKVIGTAVAEMHRKDVQDAHSLATPYVGFSVDIEIEAEAATKKIQLWDAKSQVVIADLSLTSRFEALSYVVRELTRIDSAKQNQALRNFVARFLLESSNEETFYTKLLPPLSKPNDKYEVDIIVPVYGGAAETAECIESVLAASNTTKTRLVIIDDCTPDPLIRDYLNVVEKRNLPNVIVLHRTKNVGFSEAVNMGMTIADRRDVILLNSDTVVYDGWVDRICSAANTDSRIGTVTPLSNNGEIATIPYICKSLPINDKALGAEIDFAAAQVNSGKVVDIPVAVGFCMFIRRTCIDEVGLFDAAEWGRGYGEEVDFCMQSTALGWRHVLAGDIFVIHRGNVSFGDEKLQRVLESSKKISAKYPAYDCLIQRFIKNDPARSIRRGLNLQMICKSVPLKRVLNITHSLGGGTARYVTDMATAYAKQGYVSISLEFDILGNAELTIEVPRDISRGIFREQHKEKYRATETEALRSDLEKLSINRVHLHSPIGIPSSLLEWITENHRYFLTIHDYSWICPRITLSRPGGRYCGEPPTETCMKCVGSYSAHHGLAHFLCEAGGSVEEYRKRFTHVIGRAETVFAGVKDVVLRMRSHGIEGNYRVRPHPEIMTRKAVREGKRATALADGLVRVALFGAISDIKGFHDLVSCATAAYDSKLPLRFIVIGYTMNDSVISKLPNVVITGRYEESELRTLVEAHQPHLSYFPSQVPETYSYTLSHSFNFGIWPVATDLGAHAERIRKEKFGTLIPLGLPVEKTLELFLDTALNRVWE